MLHTVDLTKALDHETYEAERDRLQLQLRRLAFELYRQQRSLVVVYEGWDAAGKGGNIRRVTEMLDPRGYQVYSISAPEGEDRTHHYLWRFWRRLRSPEDKQIVIFDRSWYGRVLVERVEGFASRAEWKRAFREINEFERQLVDADTMLVKLFLHLSRDEQERRFEVRRSTPHKRWKLTEEDWRNREKWEAYEEAIQEMLTRTSTVRAPWTILEGDDKYWARVKALGTIVERVDAGLAPADRPGAPPKKKGKKKAKKKKKKRKRG